MRQMTDSNAGDRTIAIFLLIFGLAAITDLLLDAPESLLTFHVFVELIMVLSSLGASAFLIRRIHIGRIQVQTMNLALQRENQASVEWRRRAEHFLNGLSIEMDREFDSWQLTPAEKDVAMYLLKGFSLKEVAHMTDRSERTVRQHAISVYSKSGLGGRAELSAYFLEDLLPPITAWSPEAPPT